MAEYALKTLIAEIRKDTIHSQKASLGDVQYWFLSAISIYLSESYMRRHAEHKQQNRGHIYGFEEEHKQPQWYVNREPQAVH